MIKLTKYREQIAYLFFGVLTTLINWIVFTSFIHLGVMLIISNIVSWLAAVIFAFFTNKWWVFKSTTKGFKSTLNEGLAFLASRLLTGVFELILVPVFVQFGVDGMIFNTEGLDAKILVSIAVVIGNYFISKFWIFKVTSNEQLSLKSTGGEDDE